MIKKLPEKQSKMYCISLLYMVRYVCINCLTTVSVEIKLDNNISSFLNIIVNRLVDLNIWKKEECLKWQIKL